MTRDEWITRANGVLEEIRHLLAGLGITVAPALRVVADAHPCPGYVHDALTIGFCPPAIATRVDALRWAFFSKAMGCTNVEEAARFYDVALPFVVAHETSHHLRMSAHRDDTSHFLEEQACDKLAAAIVRALPAHAHTLGPLRERCEAMREVLAATFASGPVGAFVPDATDMAAHDDETKTKLAELREITTREGLSFAALALLVPEISPDRLAEAEAKRSEARRHLDLHYARDPAEYWFASVVWLSRYLGAPGQPSLAEVLDAHLTGGAGTDAETIDALTAALRGEDAVVVEGAAAALLDRFDGAIVHDLVDEVERAPSHREAIVRVLARTWRPTWDRAAVTRLVRLEVDPGSMLHVLRLAHGAKVDPRALLPVARALAGSDVRLATELLAIEGTPGAIEAALTNDGDRGGALVDALVLRGRTFGPELSIPHDLPSRGSVQWEGLLRVYDSPREPSDAVSSLRAAAFAADLARRETGNDPLVNAFASAAIAAATDARALLVHLAGETPQLSLARAIAEHAVRRTVLDVILALTPNVHRENKAALVPTVMREGPLPRVLVDLLLADLVPHEAAPSADAMATFFAEPRTDTTARAVTEASLAISLLSKLERAVLARAIPSLFPNESESPAMATLLDRMLHLRRVSLFAGLSAERLSDLAHMTLERRFAAGDTIVRAGDRGDELYLLVEGEVRLTRTNDGHTIELATLRPPAFFGEMTLFDTQPRSANALATTPCFLLSIDGDAVRKVGRKHPEVYEGLLALLSQRVRAGGAALVK